MLIVAKHYKWNELAMNEKWFDERDSLLTVLGIKPVTSETP